MAAVFVAQHYRVKSPARISGIVTSLLVIVAFVSAYLNIAHEYGVAPLFVVGLAFFTASLVNLAREARIALTITSAVRSRPG
jgi:uncharacterized membrane protein YccC